MRDNEGNLLYEYCIPALELTFDDIDNVPVADASSVSDWNTFFDLPTYGTPFTSVVADGDTVKLYGGANITTKFMLFDSNLSLIRLDDLAGSIIAVDSSFDSTGLIYVNLPNAITVGDAAFYSSSSLATILLPKMTICSAFSFANLSPINYIYIPSCINMGISIANDNVFANNLGKTFILVIPTSIMTCNAGSPDGDIIWLQTNNTVTITTV